MKTIHMVDRIIEKSDSNDTFWYSLHWKQSKANKTIKKLNQILRGTGAKANLEHARNFNLRSIEWGVMVRGFTSTAQRKLEKKFGI